MGFRKLHLDNTHHLLQSQAYPPQEIPTPHESYHELNAPVRLLARDRHPRPPSPPTPSISLPPSSPGVGTTCSPHARRDAHWHPASSARPSAARPKPISIACEPGTYQLKAREQTEVLRRCPGVVNHRFADFLGLGAQSLQRGLNAAHGDRLEQNKRRQQHKPDNTHEHMGAK